MGRTKQIGVRFDEEQLAVVKASENIQTAQGVVNFLLGDYVRRRGAKLAGQPSDWENPVPHEESVALGVAMVREDVNNRMKEIRKMPMVPKEVFIPEARIPPRAIYYDKTLPGTDDREGLEKMRKEVSENPNIGSKDKKSLQERIDFKLNRLK